MKKFYLHNGTKQEGPFDIEELKAKNITKDTPIWYDGLADWTNAGNVDEVKSIIAVTPPALGDKMTTPPPVQKITPQEVVAEAPRQRKSIARRLLVPIVVIVLGLIGILVYGQINQQQDQAFRQKLVNEEEDNKATIRNNITSYVTAERNEYTYSKLGGIYNLQISVSNNTDYIIDKAKVKVTYIKSNGGVWDKIC